MTDIELSESEIETAKQKFESKATGDEETGKLIKPSDIEHILRDCGIVVLQVALTDYIKNEEENMMSKFSGMCDFDCFMRIYQKCIAEQPDEEVLLNAIKSLIPPGLNYVPASKMREVLMSFGDQLTEEEADEFITDCDEFGGGEMDPEMIANKLINGFL